MEREKREWKGGGGGGEACGGRECGDGAEQEGTGGGGGGEGRGGGGGGRGEGGGSVGRSCRSERRQSWTQRQPNGGLYHGGEVSPLQVLFRKTGVFVCNICNMC